MQSMPQTAVAAQREAKDDTRPLTGNEAIARGAELEVLRFAA